MIKRTPIAVYEGEVNPYEEVDYLEEAKKLVTTQFENKDVFTRYVELLLSSRPQLQEALKELMQDRSLFNAYGAQLDIIGNIVGQPRTLFDSAIIYYFGFNGAPGAVGYGTVNEEESIGFWKSINDPLLGVRSLNDEEYRALIKIKILKNTSKTDITSFIDAVRLLFGTEVVEYQEDAATLTLNIGREYNDQNQAKFAGLDEVVLASRFLNVPIGVQLFLQPPLTLDLNFAEDSYRVYEQGFETLQPKALSDAVTFTRASTGTYFDSSGVLQTAAVDEPRRDHDPVTGEPLGLLIEEQRINLALHSENLTQLPWASISTTTSSFEVSAAGVEIFETEVTSSAGSPRQRVQQVFNDLPTGTYSLTVHAKPNTDGRICLSITNTSGEVGGVAVETKDVVFNPSTETFDVVDAGIEATDYKKIGTDLYRIIVVFEVTITATVFTQLLASNFTGTIGSKGYFGGLQLEQGSFPTSYIKTQGSQVTRSADSCIRTIEGELQKTNFTLFSEASTGETAGSANIISLGRSGSFVPSRFSIDQLPTGSVRLVAYDSAATPILVTTLGAYPRENLKVAVSYGLGVAYVAINGDYYVRYLNYHDNAELDVICVGCFPASGAQVLNGTSKNVLAYPRALPAVDLINLTAPEGVSATEVEIDLTTDPSLEFDFINNYAVIQLEE